MAKRILRERIRGKVDLIPPIILAGIEKNTSQNNDAHLAAMLIIVIPEDTDDTGDLELVTKVQFDSLLDPDHGHYKWISDDWGGHGYGNCNEGGW